MGEGDGVAVGGIAVEVGAGASVGTEVGDAGLDVADGGAGVLVEDASSELHAAASRIAHARTNE